MSKLAIHIHRLEMSEGKAGVLPSMFQAQHVSIRILS